jgi:hypothetical protein
METRQKITDAIGQCFSTLEELFEEDGLELDYSMEEYVEEMILQEYDRLRGDEPDDDGDDEFANAEDVRSVANGVEGTFEMIRDDWHHISAMLADTSEDKHMEVSICVESEEDMGLSSLEKPRIVEIWQNETEGMITFKLEGCEEEFDLSDYTEYIPQVRRYLEEEE